MRPAVWVLWGLAACGPRPAVAEHPAAVEVEVVTAPPECPDVAPPGDPASAPEQDALRGLVTALDDRGGEADRYPLAADLADALVDGHADPAVRDAALALLSALTAEPGLDPVGVAADRRALAAGADARIARARVHLRHGAWLDAVEVLAPLRDADPDVWASARPFHDEAFDAHVAAERERAGALYLDARDLPREDRIAALRGVHATLSALLDAFPETGYREPLQRNLERIERELDALDVP